MLHTETVEAGTLALIKKLMSDFVLKDFFLVGGTALSLLIGHRQSIDIDLFTDLDFDASILKQHLEHSYNMERGKTIGNGVFGFIDKVKVDIIAHKYPLVKPLQLIGGIRISSLEDIGAMKLHAIVQNGSRLKDFVDVYFLLEHLPLQFFGKAYEQKYPDVNIQMAKGALLYHKDIDHLVTVKLMKGALGWNKIEKRLYQSSLKPLNIFPSEA